MLKIASESWRRTQVGSMYEGFFCCICGFLKAYYNVHHNAYFIVVRHLCLLLIWSILCVFNPKNDRINEKQ